MPRRHDDTGFKHTYGPEWLRVSSMRCCVCDRKPWWAHHVKTVGSGGRDIGNVVPLCMECHTTIEQIGRVRFEERHQIDLGSTAKAIGVHSPYASGEESAGEMG